MISANDWNSQQMLQSVDSRPFAITSTADSRAVQASNRGAHTVSAIDLQARGAVDTLEAGVGIEALAYF